MIHFDLAPQLFTATSREGEASETVGGALGFGTLESSISSNARSQRGFPYFAAVDRGRRGFSAINAKALKIPIGGGKFIFRRSVGPSRPRYITQRTLATFTQCAQSAAQIASGVDLHSWLSSFLNNLAELQSRAMTRSTPNVSGRLAQSYVVNKVEQI